MAAPTRTETLARLHRAAAAARAAEEARLAGLTAEIAACRERADALRRLIAEPAATGGREACVMAGQPMQPADLAAAARWRDRLTSEARAELARIVTLAAEAEAARSRLARAFGRERALADLLARARREARRTAERRAENACPGRAAPQSSSPEREPDGEPSADSPGMA